MKHDHANVAGPLAMRRTQAISLPAGLLGFESAKHATLVELPDEAPFLRLETAGEPGLTFLLVPAHEVVTGYEPHLPMADLTMLGLVDRRGALLLNIVTLHADGQASVNLKGPIVLNQHTWVGKQSVPLNAADYGTQFPLPTA